MVREAVACIDGGLVEEIVNEFDAKRIAEVSDGVKYVWMIEELRVRVMAKVAPMPEDAPSLCALRRIHHHLTRALIVPFR